MRTRAAKRHARDALMEGMQVAISRMPADNEIDLAIRQAAIKEFRRIEQLFGYEVGSWEPFV